MAWYSNDWLYRMKVTVDKTKIGGSDLSGFPVYVNLANLGSDFFDNVLADGADIVVTQSNGTTKENRELDSITVASSIGELHFYATALSSSVNTDFYIYYGNAAGAETNSTAVWDDNYVLVSHMRDTPDTTHVADSTQYNNDGTKDGAGTPAEATGKIEKGQQGSGNQNITWGNGASLNITGNITLEVWHNGAHPTNDYFLSKVTASDGYQFIEFDNLYFRTNGGTWEASDSQVPAGWWYGAVTGSGTTGTFYLQGVADGTFTYAAPVTNNANLITLIRNTFTADEIRLSDIARPAGWITACFNNQNSPSTFYAVGAQETPPPATGGASFSFLTPRSKFRGA